MTPTNSWNIDNIEDPDEKLKAITKKLKEHDNSLSNNLTLVDNFKGALLTVSFNVSNEDVQIRHGLDFVPGNYLVCGKSSAVHIYDGSRPSDKTFFYLRASALCDARVFIF